MLVHAHTTEVATPSPHHTTQVVRALSLYSLEGGRHGGQDQVGSLGQVALVAVFQEELVPEEMDGWTDEWMDRWTDGWTDGWTERQMPPHSFIM